MKSIPPLIPDGFILLARRTLKSALMDKPPLWSKLWQWMLLRALYKPYNGLKRGQFFTTIAEMQYAMTYKVGYRKVRPSPKQIRAAYEGFTKGHMISSYRELMRICIVILNQSNQHHQGCKVHLQCAVIFHLMLQGNT